MKVPNAATIRAGLQKRANELAKECEAADDAKWAAMERLCELDEARQRVTQMIGLPDDALVATTSELSALVEYE